MRIPDDFNGFNVKEKRSNPYDWNRTDGGVFGNISGTQQMFLFYHQAGHSSKKVTRLTKTFNTFWDSGLPIVWIVSIRYA